ncbi:MAG TPA: GNAT family N-acetyltransferase [Roseiflexaceae bacterium]|nr:GNAT family N-acetyltransferase [Roseiflexaceae bacterium]
MVELEREVFAPAVLRDGRRVTIRPLDELDHRALLAFGRALPQDDLLYLENDLATPETIGRLINARFAENWRQLVASIGDQIIGYAALRRLPGWSCHVASISLIVSAGWRRYGLGTTLAQQLVDAARELQLNKLVVEMVETQLAGRAIFDRLGFHVEGEFSGHACDRNGQRHTLIVMAQQV